MAASYVFKWIASAIAAVTVVAVVVVVVVIFIILILLLLLRVFSQRAATVSVTVDGIGIHIPQGRDEF